MSFWDTLFPFALPTLPSLPSLSIPINIQRRFLSFVLKRSLGHLLKPGQLDLHQIDAQLGNGWVEISNIELSDEAINELISGLPLRLKGGRISKVSARIPWSNLLFSPLAVTVDALDLNFILVTPPSPHPSLHSVNLAESVSNVAETFIHEELGSEEHNDLRMSMHSDLGGSSNDQRMPGSMDPFLSGESSDDGTPEDQEVEDATVLASLTERLLSRLKFSATQTRISIEHEHNTSLTLSIPDITYGADDVSSTPESRERTEARSLRIHRIILSMTDLSTPINPTSPSSESYGDEPYIDSDDDDDQRVDDAAQMLMSQSIVSLPEASMYQSALSSIAELPSIPLGSNIPSPRTPSSPAVLRQAQVVFSIDEPIIFRLDVIRRSPSIPSEPSVPPSDAPSSSTPSAIPPSVQGSSARPMRTNTTATLEIGVVAVAFQAWQIRALIRLATYVTPPASQQRPQMADTSKKKGSSPSNFEARLGVKAIVALIVEDLDESNSQLDAFFARPLFPVTRIKALHVQMDGLEGSFLASQEKSQLSISDAHIFHILPQPSSTSQSSPPSDHHSDAVPLPAASSSIPPDRANLPAVTTLPILIFDTNLGAKYSSYGTSVADIFPFLELASWDRADGAYVKPTLWRVPRPQPTKSSGASPLPGTSSITSPPGKTHVIRVMITLGGDLEVALHPIHLFLDLEVLRTLLHFSEKILGHSSGELDGDLARDSDVEFGGDALETPRAKVVDLPEDVRPNQPTSQLPSTNGSSSISLSIPVVRLEMRVPPPPSTHHSNAPRSGSLLIDICNILVTAGGVSKEDGTSRRRVSFAKSRRDANVFVTTPVAEVEWSRVLVAFANVGDSRASTWLCISPLVSLPTPSDTSFAPILETPDTPLPPKLSIRSLPPSLNRGSQIFVNCGLPQISVSLHKTTLDGLQLWADDLTQWAERAFSGASRPSQQENDDGLSSGPSSATPSLIGSRFFMKKTKSVISSSTDNSEATASAGINAYPLSRDKSSMPPTEISISIGITEASIKLWVPRAKEEALSDANVRPFSVYASDMSILASVKPEGKDETDVDFAVMDIKVLDTAVSDLQVPILFLTAPRPVAVDPDPMIKVHFASVATSDTLTAKESRVKLTTFGFTFSVIPDMTWATDLASFVKAPPGAFESVVPSERTVLSVRILECSVQLKADKHPGSLVLALNEFQLDMNLVGGSPNLALHIQAPSLWLFCIDDLGSTQSYRPSKKSHRQVASEYWKRIGFSHLVELRELNMSVRRHASPNITRNKIDINGLKLIITACADSFGEAGSFGSAFATALIAPSPPPPPERPVPPMVTNDGSLRNLLGSLDEQAFRRIPDFGSVADLIHDDLPTNPEYLDASFGAAAGFRDLTDSDLEGFDNADEPTGDEIFSPSGGAGVIEAVGGETIRLLDPQGIHPIEAYFDTLQPEDLSSELRDSVVTSIRAHNCDVKLSLYDGYDWHRTRKTIDEEVKAMRRKLMKIRQLLATGQLPDDSTEDTHRILFNSIHVGLSDDMDGMEPDALIAAIDEELIEEEVDDTVSQSSWQSLNRRQVASTIDHANPAGIRQRDRLARSKRSALDFCFSGIEAEYDIHPTESDVASRLLVMAKNVEILDHISTSTWRTFLTQMREDSRGNIRETGSNMVRIELLSVRPVPGNLSEEARLRAKILPLRLHVDQDALDFIKKFFAFSDPDKQQSATEAPPPDPSKEVFFQHVDVFPVEIKLDYKPKRVDYAALREGKTIEMMNFFHFDGSEMTLRHIEMFGVTGWTRMLDMLNDLWTPDVKANQLADVISGVEPIRSFVNVGSGVADLVLLPIAQYQKDGRIVRGVQKGTRSFVQSTAMEAIRLGAKLATGTQIILEMAESALGGSESNRGSSFSSSSMSKSELVGVVTTREAGLEFTSDDEDSDAEYHNMGLSMTADLFSRYADPPAGVREGLQDAYKTLGRNFNDAAQTILAVPMEVYERAGTEGPVRSVVRAVPIAVLKPMIGASGAVSKTLLGLRTTLDPNVRRDSDEKKYKRR